MDKVDFSKAVKNFLISILVFYNLDCGYSSTELKRVTKLIVTGARWDNSEY